MYDVEGSQLVVGLQTCTNRWLTKSWEQCRSMESQMHIKTDIRQQFMTVLEELEAYIAKYDWPVKDVDEALGYIDYWRTMVDTENRVDKIELIRG